MKILYDYQLLYGQKFGGASRIYAELISEYIKSTDVFVDLGLKYSNNEYLKEINGLELHQHKGLTEFLGGIHFRGKLKIFRQFQKVGILKNFEKINQNISIEKLKKGDFDVFHPTFYNDYFLNHLGNKPFVLTILDLIYEKYRNDEIAKREKTLKIKLACKASKIIAISENTKKDAIQILGIPENKIEVVYLGNSLDPNIQAKKPLTLPENYVLFVGGRSDYKNFSLFLKAMKPVIKKYDSLKIICTGAPFSPQEKLLFSLHGLSTKVFHCFAEEDQFPQLYKNAECFIFPSKYEGFGIPVLEAFACECPVILSNTGSLPEVGGDAAYYFNPESHHELSHAIIDLLSNNSLLQDLKTKGLLQLKKFSWQKNAKETLSIYNNII